MDADFNGWSMCDSAFFQVYVRASACFCQATKSSKHNYCKAEKIDREIGCYADQRSSPEFEILLSKKVSGVQECIKLAFENQYQYAGL